MKRYGLLPRYFAALVLAAAALGTSGCATQALNNLTKNQACTTRVSGEMAFGSITPTGKLRVSAVCKPSEESPSVNTVAAPPET